MIRTYLHRLIKPFGGLQAKACITLMAIVIVTAAAIGTAAFRRSRAQMAEVATSHTLNAARLIATTCVQRFREHDVVNLVGLCQQFVADNRLLYVAFLDADGKILAAAQKPHTLVEMLDSEGQRIKERPGEGVYIRQFSKHVAGIEAAVPVVAGQPDGQSTTIGTLLLAEDVEPLQTQLAAMAKRGIELTSAIAILVIAIGSLVMRQVVGPINKIADASMDLAYKHEFHQIEINRSDELGRLTQAFNHMAERLLRTQRDLLELNAELEKRVALRTAELETRNKQLRRIASKDPLTGLYNRRSFAELLAREIAQAQRYDHEVACMMIDLDNFKQVNDVLGHQAGDLVLRRMAEVIRKEIRQSDIAGRFGGDEFVVLLPQCSTPEALHLAKRIREQARQALTQWSTLAPKVGLSIGISDLHVCGAKTGDALINAADKALYKVKSAGKDGVATAQAEAAQVA